MKGEELRQIRELVGMTLDQIGGRMGITKQAVSQIEKRDDVQAGTIARYIGAAHELRDVRLRIEIIDPDADVAPGLELLFVTTESVKVKEIQDGR